LTSHAVTCDLWLVILRDAVGRHSSCRKKKNYLVSGNVCKCELEEKKTVQFLNRDE